MRTDELIQRLSQEAGAVPRHAAARRLAAALLVGAAAAFVGLATTLGFRPDMAEASRTWPFWMKWIVTLSVAAAAFVLVRRLGRPEGRAGLAAWAPAAPLVLVGLLGLAELWRAPAAQRADLVLGRTASQCSVAILLLAVPVFAGLLWAFRRLAPTRLRAAGAAAGVLAAAVGASVYAFACPESSAIFLATWYSLAIFAAAGAGALSGPRLMRW